MPRFAARLVLAPAHVVAAALVVVAALAIVGCAAPGNIDRNLREDSASALGLAPAAVNADDAHAIAARVDELLAKPLSREDAVTLALLNNPALARRLAELRIDAAERVRASRPPNPSLTLARLERGSERETDRGISVDLIGLLAWPFAGSAANRRYEATRNEALRDALALARETRVAWIEAIAANTTLRYAQNVLDAADAGKLYAERLAEAGNASRLDAARAQAFHAEAQADLARAETAAFTARETLVRLLGLADPARLQLPEDLPSLLDAPLAQPDSEQRAIDNRLDVQAAKRRAEATAKSLHLTQVTRMINVLDVGYQSNTSNVAPTQTGYEVTLELPLFDFGSARSSEAHARYDAALADVAATAVNARSETRAAWAGYRAAWDVAHRYQAEVLPLQEKISGEMLLRWNGMLVGPFELLDQARAQAGAVARGQDALRDFWIADARLAAVLTGTAFTGEGP